MNKCFVFFLAFVISSSSFSHTVGEVFDSAARNRVKEITSNSEAVLEVKDFWLSNQDHSWIRGFDKVLDMEYSASELHEIDMAFSKIGAIYNRSVLPCCFTNAVNANFKKDERRREICFKYGTIGEISNVASLEDELYLFTSDVWRLNSQIVYLKKWQIGMTKVYVRELRKYLRQNGVGFVTKNGVNPCEPYVNRFISALNAPKMDGLNACFSEINRPDVNFNFDELMTDSEIVSFKEQILSGEISKQSLEIAKMKLLVALGVDGYNQLVRQYNGE